MYVFQISMHNLTKFHNANVVYFSLTKVMTKYICTLGVGQGALRHANLDRAIRVKKK